MPLYEIPGPNGKVYQIEGPEGASRDDIINAITSQHEDFAAPTPPPPAEPIPQEKEYVCVKCRKMDETKFITI